MKKIPTILTALLFAGGVYAEPTQTENPPVEQTENSEEEKNQERFVKAKTFAKYLLSEEKGERTVRENKNFTLVLSRFIHNNKGYYICMQDFKEEETLDNLLILVHSEQNGIGKYLVLVDESITGNISTGESFFYIPSPYEELLPPKNILTNSNIVDPSKIIQTRSFSEKNEETREEKSYFQAEYDIFLDELIMFYDE